MDTSIVAVAVAVGRTMPFKRRREFEIVAFYVDSDHQNKGLGGSLYQKLRSYLETNGHNTCSLVTGLGMVAENVYKKTWLRR